MGGTLCRHLPRGPCDVIEEHRTRPTLPHRTLESTGSDDAIESRAAESIHLIAKTPVVGNHRRLRRITTGTSFDEPVLTQSVSHRPTIDLYTPAQIHSSAHLRTNRTRSEPTMRSHCMSVQIMPCNPRRPLPQQASSACPNAVSQPDREPRVGSCQQRERPSA
jgi:hypothetical protein